MCKHRRLWTTLRTLAFLGVVFAVAVGSMADTTPDDIAFDSELKLVEKNDWGSYRDYSIVLTIESGVPTLSINRDGNTATLVVPLDECQAMWQRLLDSGLETLTDSPPETLPDQSDFTIQYRIIDQEGGFVAHSVDEQSDPRYRVIVREILAMGNSIIEQANAGGGQ